MWRKFNRNRWGIQSRTESRINVPSIFADRQHLQFLDMDLDAIDDLGACVFYSKSRIHTTQIVQVFKRHEIDWVSLGIFDRGIDGIYKRFQLTRFEFWNQFDNFCLRFDSPSKPIVCLLLLFHPLLSLYDHPDSCDNARDRKQANDDFRYTSYACPIGWGAPSLRGAI